MPDNFSRTITTPRDWSLQGQGRTNPLDKIYLGFVKNADDVQRQGRLKVWIPELGGDKNSPDNWVTVNYCSPFAGSTSIYDAKNADGWENTQLSYGMWFIPPDLENEVICAFINGDPGRGIWMGCLYNQYMNHMVPGIPGPGPDNNPGLPVAEYKKLTAANDSSFNVANAKRPVFSPLADQLVLQGLQGDRVRGVTSSGAQRPDSIDSNDYPSRRSNDVSGILTPGGSQLVFDDNSTNAFIRIRTKTGAQVLINDSIGSVYMNNANGTNWVELSGDGYIDIYSEEDVSVRTQGTLNFHADGDINFNAGGSINMKARGVDQPFGPIILLDTTNALNDIIGKAEYTYQGRFQILDQIFDTNSTIHPVIQVVETQPQTNAEVAGNTIVANASATGNTMVSAGSMSNTNTVAIGDSTANKFAASFGCANVAVDAATISSVNKILSNSPVSSPYVVISIGTNDDPSQVKTAAPYQLLRSQIPATSKVVWLLPSNNPVASSLQKVIAAQNNDNVINLKDNPLIKLDKNGMPIDISSVVNAATNSPVLPNTSDPTMPASAPSTPGTSSGGVVFKNGMNIQFQKDVEPSYNGPIYLVEGVGTAIKLVDTGGTANAGQFNLETAADINILSHANLHQTSIKDTHILAGAGLFETAASGDINRLASGSVVDQAAAGTYSARAGGQILLSATKIHSNGPLAANATQADQSPGVQDHALVDVQYSAIDQKLINVSTAVTRLPSHEPFVGHLDSANSASIAINGQGAAPNGATVSSTRNLPPLAIVSGPHLVWGKKVNSYTNGGNDFRGKVFDMADKLGMPAASTSTGDGGSGADWLMTCMALESAQSFSPSIRCPVSSAVGLIQFMSSTASGLGTTTAALAAMTPEGQLDYVYKYLSHYKGRYKNIGDVYMAIFNGNGIGKPDDFVLYSLARGGHSADSYKSNHPYDTTGKGYITRGDCVARLNRFFQEGTKPSLLWKP